MDRKRLLEMAEAEDACGGNISVGGLAHDVGFSVNGAVCERCAGDGKAHGSDRPLEWSGPGTYPGKCPKCKGSGVELTEKHRAILRHSLGLSSRSKVPYREYFCAYVSDEDREDNDFATCQELVELGLMFAGRKINQGSMQYFFVTKAGAETVGATLPPSD